MRTWKHCIAIGLIALGFGVASAASYLPLRTDVQDDRAQVILLNHNDNLVQIEVRIPGLELSEGILDGQTWDRVMIPGGFSSAEFGKPEVPFISKLLAIPASAGVRVTFEALEIETISNIDLMPSQEEEPENMGQKSQPVRFDMAAYSQDSFAPEIEASSGDPALMRGMRIVPIRMNPVRYNPVTKELKIAHRFQVNIHFEGTDLRNTQTRNMRPVSRSWYKLMSQVVMNIDELDLDIVPMGSYLVICENDNYLVNTLMPQLLDWKKRKGHTVVLETFSPGASTTTIKNIIQDAYDTWDIPPEFVLLFGDSGQDYALAAYSSYGWDHPYSQLDGGDILADVAIGRLPADDDYQALTMINKTLFYEKHPYTANDNWYHQAVLVAGAGSGWGDAYASEVLVNRSIKSRMVERQYTRIDTFFKGWPGSSGTVISHLTGEINNGVTYANYRGYIGCDGFGTSHITSLTNAFKLPFVAILTCGTGGFAGSESRMECFSRVGSPLAPTGSIGCVGTATSGTNTRFNNTIDAGMFMGIFDENITQPGNVLNRGKIEIYLSYADHQYGYVEDFSEWNALAGDPGIELYTGAIQYMTCTVPSSMTYGENALALTVNETGVGPLEDATVCFYREGDIQEVGVTNSNGQVTLPMSVSSAGNVKVTITKQNFYPIVDSLDIIQADVAVGYFSHSIDDDNSGSSSGDGDGILNPGEDVEIPLVLKNYGNATSATSLEVTATVNDDYATLIDNFETFNNLAPGATGTSIDDLDLSLAADCPDGHIVQVVLDVSADQGSWDGIIEIEVESYDMMVRDAYTTGADPLLTPGETADFILEVANHGAKTASSLTATITSLSPYVTVNDNYASFGTVSSGGTATCSGNPFNLTADADTPPGHPADLEVTFTSSTGATQTAVFTIDLGTKSVNDPQGPDNYGYYCYDNTDLGYACAPYYNWVEINPGSGGSGQQLPIDDTSYNDDESLVVDLPFTFKFYGEETDQITVCSNGWISPTPDNAYINFRNYQIPSVTYPRGIIAPFLDDLFTGSSGYVFKWFDSANHRFVIQWDYMRHANSTGTRETFEAILYDPDYYPTPTGDGEILFQYQNIVEISGTYTDNHYSTVGIMSQDYLDGIEVVYWDTYDDPAAAELENNRAYLFTTRMEYGSMPGDIDIELTYQSGSPVPSGGGSLYFDVFIQNAGTTPVNYDAWLDIEYQGGTPTTVVVRSFTNYLPGWTINRPGMYFPVPGSYAAGNYEFFGRVGNNPSDVWDESAFPFTKSGVVDGQPFTPFVPDGVPDPFDRIITSGSPEIIPTEYELIGVYPNPFNPTSNISFALPEAGKVMLKVYDVSGRQVATLINGYRDAGMHNAVFDAANLASGIYIYRLIVGDFTATGKMVLMK